MVEEFELERRNALLLIENEIGTIIDLLNDCCFLGLEHVVPLELLDDNGWPGKYNEHTFQMLWGGGT